MSESSSTPQLEWHALRLIVHLLFICAMMLVLVSHNVHTIFCGTCDRLTSPPPYTRVDLARRIESTAASTMWRPQHTAPTIKSVIHDEEVVVSWKLMLVDTV